MYLKTLGLSSTLFILFSVPQPRLWGQQHPPQQPSTTQEKQRADEQQPSGNSSESPKPLPSPQQIVSATKNYDAEQEQKAAQEKLLFGLSRFEFIMAVLTLIYVLISLAQWRATNRALVVAYRPQLIIGIPKLISFDARQATPDRPDPMPRAHPINIGKTPAYDCRYKTWIEVLPLPFKDFTDCAMRFESWPFIIYPEVGGDDKPNRVNIKIPLGRALTNDEMGDMLKGTKGLCFRIRFDYRDAFRVGFFRSKRWADFCYFFDGRGVHALPKYNGSN